LVYDEYFELEGSFPAKVSLFVNPALAGKEENEGLCSRVRFQQRSKDFVPEG